MAARKQAEVNILAPEFEYVEFSIVGDTPLIVHAWDDKAKRMMLAKQTGKAKQSKHELKVPTNDFLNSLYWLTEKPEDGSTDEEARERFEDAMRKGAKFGFRADGIKQSFANGALRSGQDVKKVELFGTVLITGATEASTFDIAEIIGSAPIMREDMVRVGGMSKTADIRYRAQFNEWRIPLRMKYNKNGKYSLEQLLATVNAGGFAVGIGEWRPERRGQYGMYHIEV